MPFCALNRMYNEYLLQFCYFFSKKIFFFLSLTFHLKKLMCRKKRTTDESDGHFSNIYTQIVFAIVELIIQSLNYNTWSEYNNLYVIKHLLFQTDINVELSFIYLKVLFDQSSNLSVQFSAYSMVWLNEV